MAGKNTSNLETANTVARVAFDEVINTLAPAQSDLFTERYSTGAENDDLVLMTFLNTHREWLGSREYGNLEAFKQDVKLKTYEDTFDLPRKTVDYDRSGVVSRALEAKIRGTVQHGDDKIIFDSLVSASGAGPTGFDGVSLINDSHTLGGTTYDNKTTSALSFSTYDSAIVAMQGFKAANGEPLNIHPTHLVVGPKLRRIAMEITGANERIAYVSQTGAESLPGSGNSAIAAGGIPNVFMGDGVTVVVSERLTGTQDDYWYLMDLSKPAKPMMLKEERQWELIPKTEMDDDRRFALDLYVWGIEADKAPAAGAWPTIYGGIL